MIAAVMSVRLLAEDGGADFFFSFCVCESESVFFCLFVSEAKVMKWWAESRLQNCCSGIWGGVIGERRAEADVGRTCPSAGAALLLKIIYQRVSAAPA